MELNTYWHGQTTDSSADCLQNSTFTSMTSNSKSRTGRIAFVSLLCVLAAMVGALVALLALPASDFRSITRTQTDKPITSEEARVDDLFYNASPNESWCSIAHRVDAFCWGQWYIVEGLGIASRHPRTIGDPDWQQHFRDAAVKYLGLSPNPGVWIGGLCRMKDSREDWERKRPAAKPCPPEDGVDLSSS